MHTSLGRLPKNSAAEIRRILQEVSRMKIGEVNELDKKSECVSEGIIKSDCSTFWVTVYHNYPNTFEGRAWTFYILKPYGLYFLHVVNCSTCHTKLFSFWLILWYFKKWYCKMKLFQTPNISKCSWNAKEFVELDLSISSMKLHISDNLSSAVWKFWQVLTVHFSSYLPSLARNTVFTSCQEF